MLIHSESCTLKCMAKTLQQREARQLQTKLQLLPRQRQLLKLKAEAEAETAAHEEDASAECSGDEVRVRP